MKTMERRRKTPDSLSKKRQELSLQRSMWRDKSADLKLKLAANPGDRTLLVKQVEFCNDEAQKCTEALAKLNTHSQRQLRAGWGSEWRMTKVTTFR